MADAHCLDRPFPILARQLALTARAPGCVLVLWQSVPWQSSTKTLHCNFVSAGALKVQDRNPRSVIPDQAAAEGSTKLDF